MSDPCEIAESVAVGTSSAPAIENVVIALTAAASVSALFLGLTHATLVNAAEASDTEDIDTYALCVGGSAVVSTALPSLDIVHTLESLSATRSRAFLGISQTYETASASASLTFYETVMQPLVSAAASTSVVLPNTTKDSTLVSRCVASDWHQLGLYELTLSAGASTSTSFPTRSASLMSVSGADGSSVTYQTAVPTIALLVSSAAGASTTYWQTDFTLDLVSAADAGDVAYFSDPTKLAWVMNTETTAASVYSNFDFDSLAFVPNAGAFGVNDTGIYLLEGDTDSGDAIAAEVSSGFVDFKAAQQKRVDGVYFGYTSGGQISLTLETKDSGYAPYTYVIEQSSATAPTNGRVVPGKGLVGRYWRMTLRNVNGADFEVNDATVDLAISNRRL